MICKSSKCDQWTVSQTVLGKCYSHDNYSILSTCTHNVGIVHSSGETSCFSSLFPCLQYENRYLCSTSISLINKLWICSYKRYAWSEVHFWQNLNIMMNLTFLSHVCCLRTSATANLQLLSAVLHISTKFELFNSMRTKQNRIKAYNFYI